MERVTVQFLDTTDVKADTLIEGLPGIGQVGKLVAEYMIEELSAEKIAEIHSIYLPPQVIIDPQGITHLANNELYFWEGEGRRIVFLVGDHQSTTSEGHYILCQSYLDVAEHMGVRRLYTLGGYGVGHLVDTPMVLGAVNMPHLRAEAEAAGVTFRRDGTVGGIVGASGLLLGLGALRNMEGICLMGETSGYLVDPKSASRVLSVLCRLIGVAVDATTLQDRAAEMEQAIDQIREGEKAKAKDELNYIG
ncbi:MAG: proteasome assembly chaperone family protein [Methanomicrobiales archaeon]|nr:proteasome assembly chaperone family protein [Methanomicrobiales archaeon]MDI6875230.1 proteasome assembly chaperone family protein [Methanomicrobiales archaeon]